MGIKHPLHPVVEPHTPAKESSPPARRSAPCHLEDAHPWPRQDLTPQTTVSRHRAVTSRRPRTRSLPRRKAAPSGLPSRAPMALATSRARRTPPHATTMRTTPPLRHRDPGQSLSTAPARHHPWATTVASPAVEHLASPLALSRCPRHSARLRPLAHAPKSPSHPLSNAPPCRANRVHDHPT